MSFRAPLVPGLIVLVLVLSACATPGGEAVSGRESAPPPAAPGAGLDPIGQVDREALQPPERPRQQTILFPGTGSFINTQEAGPVTPFVQRDGEVTLNFERADIREVVKVVFDALNANYVIDPQVQGEVTVQTSRPLPREELIPTLETLLRMNGAALVRSDGVYKVIPAAGAVAGSAAPRLQAARSGYGVQIVPLRYISAAEMQTILQPLLPEGAVVRVDSVRNLLLLSGTAQELANAQEMVRIFDVNWLKGMSVGLFRMENVDSQTVASELDAMFGPGSQLPLAGLFRFVPISQLNAILVITPQREYLAEAAAWVRRLDDIGGERLYVYNVQNSKADYLASLLNEVFGTGERGGLAPPELAPGLTPTTLSAPAAGEEGGTAEAEAPSPGVSTQPRSAAVSSVSLGIGTERVRIVADVENNALLIWANSQTYDKIIDAVRRLDVRSRQVLVEATIAEVTLSGELRYGLQWFFKNNDVIQGHQGQGVLEFAGAASRPARTLATGFSYSIVDGEGVVRALLETLASESKVRVLSSPQLLVIDNQQARIQVGTQQPIQTSTTTTEGGVMTESIELKDTGVILEVRPQINAGGLVTMDISQEVTDVGPPDTEATGQRTFEQRRISSRVAVQGGQSIVLGGLIRDRRDNGRSGIPVLYKLPVVGALFGSTSEETERTELLVLITPQVVENSAQGVQITNELRQRMERLIPLTEWGWGNLGSAVRQ